VRLAENLRLAPIPGDDRLCRGTLLVALSKFHYSTFLALLWRALMNVAKLIEPDLYEPHAEFATAARSCPPAAGSPSDGWAMRLYGSSKSK